MVITFIGNFGVSYSSESHYKKTLERMGHKVVCLQENQTTAPTVLYEARKSDLLLWVHTHGWHIPHMDDVLERLKQEGVPTVGYHLDLWRGLKREQDLNTDQYWGIEYFFTCDKLFVPDLEAKGIKSYYLPAGVFGDECRIVEPDRAKYPHDIIFTGSYNYHPEWPYRKELIDWLKSTYGERFGHYGGDGLGVVRGNDLNQLYASAKIVIGDTLCKGFEYPFYFSDRLFEVPGRGGFMIFPYIKGLEECFVLSDPRYNLPDNNNKPTELVVYDFNNFGNLGHQIDYFLEMEADRQAIVEAGHARVKKDHTYASRLKFILDTVHGKSS